MSLVSLYFLCRLNQFCKGFRCLTRTGNAAPSAGVKKGLDLQQDAFTRRTDTVTVHGTVWDIQPEQRGSPAGRICLLMPEQSAGRRNMDGNIDEIASLATWLMVDGKLTVAVHCSAAYSGSCCVFGSSP